MEFEVTMADVAKMPRRTGPTMCKKCQQNPPVITTRNEALCQDCFIIYIRSKFTKHMESFRVKRGTEVNRRRIMATTSFGISSSAMIDILHWHRNSQLERAKRAEYDVVVVHIDESLSDDGEEMLQERLSLLREQYPQFEFKSVSLHSIYEHDIAVEDSISAIDLNTNASSPTTTTTSSPQTPLERLKKLLSSFPSRASQADILSILRNRLIVELARNDNCEAVVLADSMTKMAQMILSEVTKGRGHAIPWLISDGPTPYDMSIYRPFRDISKAELTSFVDFSNLWNYTDTTRKFAIAPPKTIANSKNITIDELMGQFFGDISNSHLMANVVKTAGKIELPDAPERLNRLGLCEICQLPMDENPKLRQLRAANGGEGELVEQEHLDVDSSDARIYSLEPAEGEGDLKRRRCYGCRRATLGAGKLDWPMKNR